MITLKDIELAFEAKFAIDKNWSFELAREAIGWEVNGLRRSWGSPGRRQRICERARNDRP